MEYCILGRTGIRVSRICLGTFPFGVTPLEDGVDALVHGALDLGINFIDTANSYGNQHRFDHPSAPPWYTRKSSEELLGKALKSKWDQVIIASKVQERMSDGPNDGGPDGGGLTRYHMMRQVEQSLRRLGTDHLDILHAHHPDPTTPTDETMRAFDQLVRDGKVRYIALSDHSAWQLTEAVSAADLLGLHRPVCHQVRYHLADRAVEWDVAPAGLRLGIPLTAFSPLGGGLLTGVDRLDRAHIGHRRGNAGEGHAFLPAEVQFARRFDAMAREWGYTPAQVAIAWVLAKPAVACAITGPETIAEVEEDVSALSVKLDAAQMAALEALTPWVV